MASSLNGTGVTFSDSTSQASARTGPNITAITTAGSGTFTIPAGITALKVTVIGAGAGYTGANGYCCGNGYPGGHGGMAVKWLTGLTPGLTLSYTVGAGSAGTTGNTATTAAGGTSSVSSGSQAISTISATGGFGASSTYPTTGRGGSGSGGTFNFTAMPQMRTGGGAYVTTTPGVLTYAQPSATITDNANANGGTGLYPGAAGGPSRSANAANSTGGTGAAGGVFFEW